MNCTNRVFVLTILALQCLISTAFTSIDPGFRSNLRIPAQQEFILGAFELGAYDAKLKNVKSIPVRLRVVSKTTGKSTDLSALKANASLELSVSADQIVYIANDSNRQARLDVRLSRFVSGMSYQDL